MIEKIIKLYEALNAELVVEYLFNDKITRYGIKTRLETELPDCEICCDETNNPPNVVDSGACVARVMWKTHSGHEFKYVDLIFGRPEQIVKYQDEI